MTSTGSRAPYVAQTPDVMLFGANAATGSIPLARLDDVPTRTNDCDDAFPQAGLRKTWNTLTTKCATVYKNNIGLLLIAISVAFASMMSTLVKLMNSVDPPVPMLEVILICSSIPMPALISLSTSSFSFEWWVHICAL